MPDPSPISTTTDRPTAPRGAWSRGPVVPSSSGPSPVVPLSCGPVVLWSRGLLSRGLWSHARVFLPLALFSLLWLDLIRQLSYQWSANEQYAYGWFVPLLALGLFWKKWPTRPRARSPMPPWLQSPVLQLPEEPVPMPWLKGLPIPWSGGHAIAWPFLLFVFVAFLAVLLLPIRVVHEINQDWPLASWPLAFITTVITLFALFLAGGLRWVGHFAFPALFILVAVQWPYRIEHGLTQGLMQAVVAVTVKVLSSFDVMALQRGTVIELSTGVVGVDEACAGIRSFQSTLMGALFIGEWYRFNVPQRLKLLIGGLIVSFGLNIVRTLFLTGYASASGIEVIKKLHDPAGFSIFILSFACLWVLAWYIRKRAAARDKWARIKSGEAPEDASVRQVSSAGVPGFDTLLVNPEFRRFLIVAGCWALIVFGFTEVWYRSHEVKNSGVFHWSASPPENGSEAALELSPRVVSMLGYDEAVTARWQENSGADFSLFFFRWKPMSAQSATRARMHRPEVCLPAAGFRLVSESALVHFQAGNLNLPFRKYVYDAQGAKFYVFFCLWEDGAETQPGAGASKQADRIQSALKGRRWLGQQTLEIVLTGCRSLQEAEQEVRKRLPSLIRIGEPPA